MDEAGDNDAVKNGEDAMSSVKAKTLAKGGQGRQGPEKGPHPPPPTPPSGVSPPRAWIGYGQSGRAEGEDPAPAGPLGKLRGLRPRSLGRTPWLGSSRAGVGCGRVRGCGGRGSQVVGRRVEQAQTQAQAQRRRRHQQAGRALAQVGVTRSAVRGSGAGGAQARGQAQAQVRAGAAAGGQALGRRRCRPGQQVQPAGAGPVRQAGARDRAGARGTAQGRGTARGAREDGAGAGAGGSRRRSRRSRRTGRRRQSPQEQAHRSRAGCRAGLQVSRAEWGRGRPRGLAGSKEACPGRAGIRT